MKKLYSTRSFIKVVSCGTVVATLLSSVSFVFATSFAIEGTSVLNADSSLLACSPNSQVNIALSGNNNNCVAGNISGYADQNSNFGKLKTAENVYKVSGPNQVVKDYNSRGAVAKQGVLSGDKQVSNNEAYMETLANDTPKAFRVSAITNEKVVPLPRASSVVSGDGAMVSGQYGVALGSNAQTQENGIAIGLNANAHTANSIAIGQGVHVYATGGVAVGAQSASRVDKGALGYSPSDDAATDIGDAIWKSTLASFSIGDITNNLTRQLAGVAAGSADTDAVNVAQLKAVRKLAVQPWQLSINGGSTISVRANSPINFKTDGNGNDGNIKIATGTSQNIIFSLANNIKVDSVVTGESSLSDTGLTITNGPSMTRSGIIAGSKAIAGVAKGAIAADSAEAVNGSQLFEVKNEVKGDVSALSSNISQHLGGNADVLQNNLPSYTIRSQAYDNVRDAFGAVDNSITDIYSKVSDMSDNDLVQYNDGIVTVGKLIGGSVIDILNKDGIARVISGVKEGALTGKSTDAVNGAQLYIALGKIDSLTGYLGGGANVSTNTAPTYTVDNNNYSNVADAFRGVDEFIKNITDTVADVASSPLIQQEGGDGGDIMIGKVVEGAAINITNRDNVARTISGVKEGAISSSSSEAVNGAQLYALGAKIASSFGGGAMYNGAWTVPSFRISEFNNIGISEEKTYNDVAGAFGGVNTSLSNISARIDEITDEFDPDGILHWNEGEKAYDASHHGTNNRIINVEVGEVARNSTDAINGGQLFAVADQLTSYFGGRAAYLGDADESGGKAPFYTIRTQSYNNVGAAFSAVDASIADIYSKISDAPGSSGLIAYDGDAHLITIGKTVEGTEIDILNQEGMARTISGVKEGAISASSLEAINGAQLYVLGAQIASSFGGGAMYNGAWTAPSFRVSEFNNIGISEEKTYNNVADAFGGVNTSLSNISARIDEITDEFDPDGILHWNEGERAYDASHHGTNNRIINVAEGEVAEDSTDAINGGQLWKTNERVTNVESKINGIEHKFSSLSDGVVLYDLGQDGEKSNKITLAGGDESEPVIIDNLADGHIAEGSKEAVNGGQLHEYTKQQMEIVLDDAKEYTDKRVNNIIVNAIDDTVEISKQYTDMKFDVLSYSVEGAKKEARQAAAIGLAVSNLRYNDTPGKLSVGFGAGIWRSQSAFALGAGYTSESGGVRSNLSVTNSGGHWGVGAGLNITLN